MKRYIKASIESELGKYENSGKFDYDQMEEIREGLEDGVDVSVYADPKYAWSQMRHIRKGLESGVDVSIYADPKYDWSQMDEIRKGLEDGVDVSVYTDLKYDWEQMCQIRLGLEHGVDVSVYVDPKYDSSQMRQIRWGLEKGLDVSKYADPKYDEYQMYEIREKLEGKTQQKAKRVNWKSIVSQLEEEAEYGTDSFYELTDAGEYVTSICQGVEDKLGIFAEPSIQGGRGSIYFSHDEWGSASMDYEYFNECVYDMAVESKNKTEFKNRYEGFLEDLDWE